MIPALSRHLSSISTKISSKHRNIRIENSCLEACVSEPGMGLLLELVSKGMKKKEVEIHFSSFFWSKTNVGRATPGQVLLRRAEECKAL